MKNKKIFPGRVHHVLATLTIAAASVVFSGQLWADDDTPAAQSTMPFLTEDSAPTDATGLVAVPAAAGAKSQSLMTMDLTKKPTNIWDRIRNGFGLPDISTPLVREQEDWFAKRPDYIKRTIARSSRYLYYIMEEVQKRGMPSEIALLPIIESAYNPVAYSPAHASGIWQFIPSTGRLYGLQQNFWYDGRRDVVAATNAALDYLQKLYDMFGSWDLALASYNWGEGAVTRAIQRNAARNLPTDYLSLSMPQETRDYLPKLQAIKNIIAHPAQYGLELADVPNQPYFVAVNASKHIDVKLAAKFADVPLQEFISLNPGINRPVIQANDQRTLLLPADKADAFMANLQNSDQPLVSWQAYKLKPGETLDKVAAHHHISLAQLREVNSIGGKVRVKSGSTLLVPKDGNSDTAAQLPDVPMIVQASEETHSSHGRNGHRSSHKSSGSYKVAKLESSSHTSHSEHNRSGHKSHSAGSSHTEKVALHSHGESKRVKVVMGAKSQPASSKKKLVLAQNSKNYTR